MGPIHQDLSLEDVRLDPCHQTLIDVPYIRTDPSTLLAHRDAGTAEVHRIYLHLVVISDLHYLSFVLLSFERENFLEVHPCRHNDLADYCDCSMVMAWALAVP